MTISVPPDLQYGLLEFIAHMNAEDYDALPEDFVKIGKLSSVIPFHIHYLTYLFLLGILGQVPPLLIA